MSIDHITA